MIPENEDIYAQYTNQQVFKIVNLQGKQFRLPQRYRPFKIIGSGAYGMVCAAIDQSIEAKDQKEKLVAIKKISQKECSRILYKRILRQMKILRNLNSKNIVKLKDIILPESRSAFNDLYLVFQFCDSDLHVTIRNSLLTEDHIRYFSLEIIKGINFLHSYEILHRDLKPRNVLVTKECELKICDFGLSRFVPQKVKEDNLTDYVTTRWYRAPQLLLGFTDYTKAVDIWSIGCLIAEMIMGKALFPGNNSTKQWQLIIEFTGFCKEDISGFNEDIQEFLIGLFKYERNGNRQFLFDKCPEGADLVEKMLKLDPAKRITLKEAMQHPFMKPYSKNAKIELMNPINPLQFQFQNTTFEISREQLKDMIYEEILLYHYPSFAEQYKNKINHSESVVGHILQKNLGQTAMEEEDSMDEHF